MNTTTVPEEKPEAVTPGPPAPPRPKPKAWLSQTVQKIWDLELRLIRPFLESFLPKPHYLDGEVIQQVIDMAGYRIKAPKIFGVIGVLMFVPGVVGYILTLWAGLESGEMFAGAIAVLGLFFIAEAIWGWLAYHQWQFILTDKRIILVTPDPDRQGFADAIYLKRGKIQVLDTNFSHSPIWGIFQIITGSRDVMLSMGGYEFYETGAKVKGGLRFPDVVPEDIRQLEQLIFG